MENTRLAFDQNGYLLPYDIVPVDWDMFVKTFGESNHRQGLLSHYKRFLASLYTILPVAHRQWIDGSFISQQEKPGDIDAVVLVPHVQFAHTIGQLKKLKSEWKGRIDCYFVETFPPDHRKYEISQADELTWFHFLSTDRRKRRKGILELQFDYGNQR